MLPCVKTIHSFFGKFRSAVNENECVQAVSDVSASLEEQEKFVFISAGEIYVKPSIRFRAGYIIGLAQNQEKLTPAKTLLALMIKLVRGIITFVARLSPVLNLKHEYFKHHFGFGKNNSQSWRLRI